MSKAKKLIILFGDIILLYASLVATLLIRYKTSEFPEVFTNHIKPFSVIFIIWIIIFYLNDLYRERFVALNFSTIQRCLFSVFLGAIISIVLFYLFASFFQLTPKTNLFIFSVIFALLDLGWRFSLAKLYISSGWRNRILTVGQSPIINEIIGHLKSNPQMGYDIAGQVSDLSEIKNLSQIISEKHVNTVIIQPNFKKDTEIAKAAYKLLAAKILITDSVTFYETIFQKLAFEELEESWFVEKIIILRPAYEFLKRMFDIFLSFILLIALSPVIAIIALLVKITSKGPSIYKQERTGLNNKTFVLYKFRTMVTGHNGPLWTTQNDSRLTSIGKFLRYSHLDEIPQLYNILKGDISFIGPRAERTELAELYRQLSYYDLRHIIKPGLTGWAQVNYKPSASVEEAKEKLRYDIYYIKNRSLPIDFLILLKTVKYLFTSLK
ncbi:MAG: sugar transferase [Patescibacteria group bacterium]|nr:sugar transferase [Patescibacteria group bacterium]